MYHTRLTKLLEDTARDDGASAMPSDIEKAALDSIAEALDLSREQVKPPLVGSLLGSVTGEGGGRARRQVGGRYQ